MVDTKIKDENHCFPAVRDFMSEGQTLSQLRHQVHPGECFSEWIEHGTRVSQSPA